MDKTLAQAKAELRQGWEGGVSCPCCGQFVKKYARKLTTSMAVGLISLYRQSAKGAVAVHIKKIEMLNGGEFAQLRRWGLIREVKNEDTSKRTSGLWLITSKGIDFVEGNIQVPRYCDTYNGKTLGFSDEQTDIHQALGSKFNYREMMGWLWT